MRKKRSIGSRLADEVYQAVALPWASYFSANALWRLDQLGLLSRKDIEAKGYERLRQLPRIGDDTARFICERLDVPIPNPPPKETVPMAPNSVNVEEALSLLGKKATDKVTGFEGIVTSVCFDLYGCIQCIVCPSVGKDTKLGDSHWFDSKRLKISGKPVMEVPIFDSVPGPEAKPAFPAGPR